MILSSLYDAIRYIVHVSSSAKHSKWNAHVFRHVSTGNVTHGASRKHDVDFDIYGNS